MNPEFDGNSAPELTADEEALLKEMPDLTEVGVTRRNFIKGTIVGSRTMRCSATAPQSLSRWGR